MNDEARDLRWQAFMDWARARYMPQLLFLCARYVGTSGQHLRVVLDEHYFPLADFIEEHDWSGTLLALSQLQKEQEHKRAA